MASGYQVLARKYRPQRFVDVIGQEHATDTLKNALTQGRIAHGYIFSGHRGIGKTTVARILAMALNCRSQENPVAEPCGVCDSCVEIREGRSVDVMEIDAATNRGIDEVRELREAARYRPARDRYKIWILDEAHQITEAAFNALLKTLEEPPAHVVFMLATTQPEDIPQTIRSRCQHFSFRAVRFAQIMQQLRDIVKSEGIEADEDALALLAEAGDGSMRDALSLMDQAIAGIDTHLSAAHVRLLVGSSPSSTLEEMMASIERGASQEVLERVDTLLAEGQNPSHFAAQLVRFLRNAIVAKVAGSDSALLQISSEERARTARVAAMFGEEDLTRHLQIMLRTHGELGYRNEQRFLLELGLLKMVHAQRLLPLEQLLSGQLLSGQIPQSAGNTPPATRGSAPLSPPSRDLRRETTGASGPAAPAQPNSQRSTSPPSVSPFAADSARKGNMRSDGVPEGGPRPVTPISGPQVIMGSAAPDSRPDAFAIPQTTAVAPAPELTLAPAPQATESDRPAPSPASSPDAAALRDAICTALEQANQSMVAEMVEDAVVTLTGSELSLRLAVPESAASVTFGQAARRIAATAASNFAGKTITVKISGGAAAASTAGQAGAAKTSSRPQAAGTARARAAQDPMVRKMQETFGAEIRTVMDLQREK